VPRITPDAAWHAEAIVVLAARLDEEAFTEAWTEGRTMSPDQILEEALLVIESIARRTEAAPTNPAPVRAVPATRDEGAPGTASSNHAGGRLSERERQVLRLVADGRSNKEISQALVVTVHTAKAHVASILKKLGASTRAQAAALAAQRGLLTPPSEADA